MYVNMRISKRGFTLIELAIVLAIAGILFTGLWRLLSGGNQQLRDQAAASSQQQLISSAKAYLATSQGQGYMQTQNANAAFALTLPTTAPDGGANTNCKLTTSIPAAVSGFCDFLPIGFTNATTNSYGQSFTINVLKDNSPTGTKPTTYSFMVITTGGDVIPDTSGGRITSVIGGDGGFVYSSDVCNAQSGAVTKYSACGAYGSWAAATTSYGFNAAGGYIGSIATRTYVAPENDASLPWLSRLWLNNSATYNTMYADMFVDANGNGAHAGNANIYMTKDMATTTGGGSIFLNGGSINGGGTGAMTMTGDTTTANYLLNVINTATCTMTAPNVPITCPYAAQVTTLNVTNLLQATALYAGTFIYQSSDMRLKTNIHPVEDSLADVMRLKPVHFTFKSNGKESLGVIAQDIEKVYPELVVPGVNGMKAVNYEGLIAPLIGSVQQLKQDNDHLRQQLHEQELRQEKLEKQLQQRAP